MGSNVTDANVPLFGILVPWAVTLPQAVDTGASIDWTEASQEPGACVPSASTGGALELSGDSTTVAGTTIRAVQLQAVQPGGPGPSGAGVAYRYATSNGGGYGSWYGCDAYHVLTGYQQVSTDNAKRPSVVALDDGTIIAVWSTSTACRYAVRTPAGVWGSPATLISTTHVLACAARLPDGSVGIYVSDVLPGRTTAERAIRLYRSSDSGATWSLQTYDVSGGNGWTIGTASTHLRAASSGGAVVMFRTYTVAGQPFVQQYTSTDGGFTFSRIGSGALISNGVVWDVTAYGGLLHTVSSEDTTGTPKVYYRKLGTASTSIANTSRVELATSATAGKSAAIAVHPNGTMYVCYDASRDGLAGKRSLDGGATWDAYGPTANQGVATDTLGFPSMAFSLGSLVVAANLGEVGTDVLTETVYGGHSTVTVSSQIIPWSPLYLPLNLLSASGWSNTDTGSVTRSLTTTGERIQTGVGAQAISEATVVADGPTVTLMVVRCASGTPDYLQIRLDTDDGTDNYRVAINVSDTQMRAYDGSGAAPAFTTTHTAADYPELLAVCDPINKRAVVWYRIFGATPERGWTVLATITGMGTAGSGGGSVTRFESGESQDVYIRLAASARAQSTTLSNGITSPSELDPVLVSSALVPLTGLVRVSMTSPFLARDGVTWTSYATSAYRANLMLPTVTPSPSVAWRSANTSGDTSFLLTLPQTDVPRLYGLYLDGLVGVGALSVTDDAGTSTVTLTTAAKYDSLATKAIEPTRSGSVNTGPWVRADELVGWHFKDSAGTVFTVTGNSAGALTYGSTIAEDRAVIYLSGTPAAGTNQTGTLYPKRVLCLRYLSTSQVVSTVTVAIAAASNTAPPEGYRSIGVLALGKVHVVGEAPDLDDAAITSDEANLQTQADGSTYAARRYGDRETVDLHWVGSVHEVRALLSGTTSPDYVTAVTNGAPVASRTGVPEVVRGIIARAAATDAPVVLCPRVPVESSTGWTVARWNLGNLTYGRIVGGLRREAVQYVGTVGRTQVYRVPVLTVREEK